MQPCLKVNTYCEIQLDPGFTNGRIVRGMNSCSVDGLNICPRVTAGSKSGEDYALCQPQSHAEITALAKLDHFTQYPQSIATV